MSGKTQRPFNTTSNPKNYSQQVTLPHTCPVTGDHIRGQMIERAVEAVTRNLSWDYQQLSRKQQQFLNVWISAHTRAIAQHIDHVPAWLRGLTLEEIVSEGMTLASEICWIKYKGEGLE